ncbi:restriction endonuclease subunit S [Algoriphagus sp. D3-2-R+10]|uniref:restriction endonuclease subunit S n=1 Tax=Algoriphagus aurantiacus TaxID=3103948 RepID=UPI002B37323C|nr:restriction endonuclease subunit S [Algoriphagus sp. D3-2-R+10]MEB2774984.1 restriction endonuclease subunit S [Algoriphagus sp. D3-2-R+10]
MIKIKKVDAIAELNKRNISSKDNLEFINYLDTSSITKNNISSIQFLDKDFPSRAKRKVQNKTILYSTVRPEQEHYGIAENLNIENFIVSTGFTTIDVTSSEVEPKFLYYLLTQPSIIQYLQGIAENSVSAYPSIKPEVIGELRFRFPSLQTQQKIASILSALDDKIELNNRTSTELEKMAKLIYEYWFVQFDFPFDFRKDKPADETSRAEDIKPYKSAGGKMVWNKELKREIPEGWEVGDLEELSDFNPSLKIGRNAVAPYLGMTSISTSGYMTEIPEEKGFTGGIKFQNGDIVVARITPCLENGKTALITMLEEGSIGFGSTEFINIRAKEKCHISYLAILCRSDSFRNYAISKMTGTSGRKRVDAKELAKFRLPVPPDNLLKKYGDLIDPYFQKMTSNANQNQELASLRDWLLPMLMNGQVTVPDAEELVEEKLGMVAEERGSYGNK